MSHAFGSFIKNPERVSYDGKDKDEQVLYIIRKSKLVLLAKLLIPVFMSVLPIYVIPALEKTNIRNGTSTGMGLALLVILFWYLICFGSFLSVYVNWYFNVFIITNKKIVDMDVHGLLYKNISETTLNNIEDVTSTVKGTLGMLFNIGEVFLQTAAEKMEFEFNMVDNPSEIRDVISDLVANLKSHGRNN